jgi:regulator of protease activity HflC (stomatin/prohibitin superfamily)
MVNKIAITWGLIIIVIFASLLSVVYISQSWVSIGVGHALLVVDMGNSGAPIENRISVVLGPATGFFVNGWSKMIGLQRTVDIYYATDVFDGVIPCFSADQLEMNITIQMRWSLNTSRLIQLYSNYPKLDYEQTAIDSLMEKNIRFVTKNFSALDTIAHRPEIAAEMQDLVFQSLRGEPSLAGALAYMTFDLKNIAYPENYTRAIESKLAAQQQELQAEFERNRILILANATAQEAIIEALGQAQARIAVAQGTQEAIHLLIESAGVGSNSTASAQIAQLYIYTEALKSIAPYIKSLILMQQGITPIINIPTNSTNP